MSNFKRRFKSTKGNERTQPISKNSAMSADDLDDDFGFDDDHHQQIDQGKNSTKKDTSRDEEVEENPRKKKKTNNKKDTTKTAEDSSSSSSSSIMKGVTAILPPPPSAEIGDPEKLLEQIQLPSNIKPEEIPLQVWVKAAGRKGVLQQMVEKLSRKKAARKTKETHPAIKAAGFPEEEAKFFNTHFFRECGSQMSPLERESLALKAKHFLVPDSKSSSSEELVRKYLTHTDPQYFDDFLRDVLPKDAAEILAPRGPKDTFGSPIVLVMSSAAIRSSNLYSNCLRGGLQARGTEMTKLFAKHFTLEEHMRILSRTVTRIAFATPNRVLKLLDTPSSFFNSTSSSSSSSSSSASSVSALNLDSCKYLVIDLFLNKQEKTTFEVSEVAKDLWDLYKKHLHHRVVEGKMKIIFY